MVVVVVVVAVAGVVRVVVVVLDYLGSGCPCPDGARTTKGSPTTCGRLSWSKTTGMTGSAVVDMNEMESRIVDNSQELARA